VGYETEYVCKGLDEGVQKGSRRILKYYPEIRLKELRKPNKNLETAFHMRIFALKGLSARYHSAKRLRGSGSQMSVA
jgi:hypothetical protein